jgi:hypothetical protein
MQSVTIQSGSTIPFVVKPGEYIKINTSALSAGTVAVPGEAIAETLAASRGYAYGGFAVQREVIVRLSSGSAEVMVEGGAPPVELGRSSGAASNAITDPASLDAVRGAVGVRKTGVWAFRPLSGIIAEASFSNTFCSVVETPFEPGQTVRVRGRTINDLYADTGVLAGAGLGNGRYAVNTFQVASGSAYADNNPLAADGVTARSFVAAPKAAWSSVDGQGPTNMVQFTPAAPADPSVNGVYGYAATPWVDVTLEPRRDGQPGSVIYYIHQYGGGGASSQHPRGTVSLGAIGMQNVAGLQKYRTMRNAGAAPGDWGTATDRDCGYHVMWLEVHGAQNCVTVARCGDSTRIGTGTTGGCTNAVWRAVSSLMSSDSSKMYGYTCLATGGSAAPWFHGQALDRLKNEQEPPSILFLQVTSQNVSALTTGSPFTSSQVLADWDRALQIIELCDRIGVRVVLETQQPTQYIQAIYALGGANQATALAMEQQRVLLNAWIRASGRTILDVDGILSGGTYANGIAYLKGYTDTSLTIDGIHSNDAGELLVMPFAVASIKGAMTENIVPNGSGKPPKTITYTPASDGTKTAFSVPHGMGSTPSDVQVRAGNALTAGLPFVTTFDVNLITYTYATAPAAGALSFVAKVYW